METGRHCVGCPPEDGITKADLAVLRPNLPQLAVALSRALQFEAVCNPPPRTPAVLPIGTLDRRGVPTAIHLALAEAHAESDLLLALQALEAPAVVFFLTGRPTVLSLLRRKQILPFALPALVTLKPGGRLSATTSLEVRITEQQAGTDPRSNEPLPLRGKRYEISPDYGTVTALEKPRRSFAVTAPLAIGCLKTLIESGAGSLQTAIPKKLLLVAAYRYAGSRPPPSGAKPAHLLRQTVTTKKGRRTKPLPFRDDILRKNPTGGLYWLEL
jgi:hypothetical protein